MQAAERESRQHRWNVWHTAALPLMKRFPKADTFIDPDRKPERPPATETFLRLRSFDSAPPPDWVLEKFGLPTSAKEIN